jgi:CHAT domain-containing protein
VAHDHPHLGASLTNLAATYHRLGRYEDAIITHRRALSIFEKALGLEHINVSRSLSNLSALELANGDLPGAVELQRRAVDIEERNLARSLFVVQDSRQLARASTLLKSTHDVLSLHLQAGSSDRSAANLALTTLLRRKGRIQDFAARLHVTTRRELPKEHEHLLDELSSMQSRHAALVHRGPGNRTTDAYRARISALELEQDVFWVRMRELIPRIQMLADPVAIPDVQSQLPSDAALVEYVRHRATFGLGAPEGTELRYAAYIVFPHRFDWVDLGPAAPIDEQVRSFREAIVRKADADALGHALYESIMKPVVDRLGATVRLFIAPDGNLNLVPFDALVDEYDNYLVERFHLHYLTSGRDLLRPWTLEPVADGPVVVVANPAGADLPGTEREATLLASLFGDAVTMRHEDATEIQLRAHERPRILHLATHGTFGTGRPGHTLLDAPPDDDLFRSGGSVFDGLPPTQLDNPMLYSWLDLATPPTPPDDQPDTDEALLDDGRLTAYEVSGWDLRGTELVTLSACDTAQGTYQQGEGILGLRRAFAVSDTSTVTLMASYYRRLLAGEGRSEAMRNTQLELLRNPETRHPRDWAAFVVVGEWAPLSSITPPPKANPDPIDSRPRGCQATLGLQNNAAPTTLLLLPLLALTRRRRAFTRD